MCGSLFPRGRSQRSREYIPRCCAAQTLSEHVFAVAFRAAFPIVSRFGSWWCGKQDKLTSHSESISSTEKYRVGSVGDQMFSRGGERGGINPLPGLPWRTYPAALTCPFYLNQNCLYASDSE